MTRKELVEALKTVVPEQEVNAINLPMVLTFAAVKLWVAEVPEGPSTSLIREALKTIAREGHFDFQEE